MSQNLGVDAGDFESLTQRLCLEPLSIHERSKNRILDGEISSWSVHPRVNQRQEGRATLSESEGDKSER